MGDYFVSLEQTGKSLATKFSLASSSMRAAFATMDLRSSQRKMRTGSGDGSLTGSMHSDVPPAAADQSSVTRLQANDAHIQAKVEKISMHMYDRVTDRHSHGH